MAKNYRQPVYKAPPDAADLLLIRHGESAPAVAGQDFPTRDGHGDPPLHPAGVAQAKAVGARLKDVGIAAIYVTKLQRTQQTAAPLAELTGLTPIQDPDLHEVHLGDWDGGLYRIKAAERDPVHLQMLAAQDWSVIPNAEPKEVFLARVRRGLERIAKAERGRRAAVVVHGGVIAAALSLASGSAPFAFQGAANGSISRLVIDPSRWLVRGFNDTAHLLGMNADF